VLESSVSQLASGLLWHEGAGQPEEGSVAVQDFRAFFERTTGNTLRRRYG